MAIGDDDIERLKATVSLVDVVGEVVPLRKVGAQLRRAVPVPRREDAVVQRPRGDRALPLLRLRPVGRRRSRSSSGPATSTSSAPSSTSLPRSACSSTYTTSGQSAERQRRKRLVEAMATAVEWYHRAAARRSRRPSGSRLPAQPRSARRRRQAVQARLGAGRVGRARPAVRHRQRAAARHRAGVRQPHRADAGRLPRPRPVPDLLRHRRCRRGRGPGPARIEPIRRSTRTRRRRRSTRSRGRCTASTGRRPTSPTTTRSSCARATPT